jgi:hypothetical protein
LVKICPKASKKPIEVEAQYPCLSNQRSMGMALATTSTKTTSSSISFSSAAVTISNLGTNKKYQNVFTFCMMTENPLKSEKQVHKS